jgi:hypothetical protein
MGDDTGAIPLGGAISSFYTSSYATISYFDSAAGVVAVVSYTNGSTSYVVGAGELFVDLSDNAFSGVLRNGIGVSSLNNGFAFLPWNVLDPLDASRDIRIAINHGGAVHGFGLAYYPSLWAYQQSGVDNVLEDSVNSKAWFAPIYLIGQRKGRGAELKLRQMAFGPGVTAPHAVYSISVGGTPTVAAIAGSNGSGGSSTYGFLWFTQFKL